MNGLPYYKAYPRDFIEGTIGMAFELKGAYRLVLDLIYMQNGRLPDDARYISGQLGCTVRAWNGYREQLVKLGKLTVENGIISNFRASLELDNLAEISRKNAENGRLSHKNKSLGQAVANRSVSHTEPDTDTERKREVGKPTSCPFSDFWAVWPNKTAKRNAEKAWAKLSADDRAAAIRLAPEWFEAWRKASPTLSAIHPASFLNGRRWEDAMPAGSPANVTRIFDFSKTVNQT